VSLINETVYPISATENCRSKFCLLHILWSITGLNEHNTKAGRKK
jgi:hypothetical protein